MDKFVSLLRDALAAMKGSPLAVITLLLVGGVAGYWVSHERITLRDEQITDLKRRLEGYENTPPDFGKKSNADLQRAALYLATKIRSLFREASTQSDRMMQEFAAATRAVEADGGSIRPVDNAEIDKKWRDQNVDMVNTYQRIVDTYNRSYKSDAIVMRDAMLERLQASQRLDSMKSLQYPQAYENAVIPQFIEAVATNLEVLAKKLPTDGQH